MSSVLAPFIYEDEKEIVQELIHELQWGEEERERTRKRALELVQTVRKSKRNLGELESFLQQYGLNTEEGLALMTLAEALLRIPDARTAIDLINDKMSAAEWLSQQGSTKDMIVRAAGWGLTLTQKTLDSAMSRLGEPVIRKAMAQAIRSLGKKFVLGQSIEDGIKTARSYEKKGYRMSYDMLGEGARTMKDAERYYEHYKYALEYIAENLDESAPKHQRPGLSVKLSALHPRYEYRKKADCVPALIEKLTELCKIAAAHDIALTVDAEEVERLEVSIEIIRALIEDKQFKDWDGFGLAVQAYQKRAVALIEHLADITEAAGRRIQVRLVKGAYWDTEIKRAQVLGLRDYPVFTRKANTDMSYMTCAQKLMKRRDVFYPMFATHNAHTIASVLEMAGNDQSGEENGSYEFQRLHGMGETLHNTILEDYNVHISIYAPCGSHEELLPYLVRRLLENGATSSFVHKILDARIPPEDIVQDPIRNVINHETCRHLNIPLPANIYGDSRLNSQGIDLTEVSHLTPILEHIDEWVVPKTYSAAPIVDGKIYQEGEQISIFNPADKSQLIGHVWNANDELINSAFQIARKGYDLWRHYDANDRADILEKLGDLLEDNAEELLGLCTLEAGKTLDDGVAEIREAVDFCRYYAMRGRIDFSEDGIELPGPTGEKNILKHRSRGVFVCISPWNFPLAIYLGQITAALMAGNAVIAKPAEQTPLIATRAAELILEAGVPPAAFSLLTGDGKIGAAMVKHAAVSGVTFTGSTQAAKAINLSLAQKDGAIVPLIAETGGQNAMIVDSSALPEQIIDDVMISAFGSAGQRCSALRVLYVQDDIAERLINMLKGAMEKRVIGNPIDPSVDIGPVIDQEALSKLQEHKAVVEGFGTLIAESPITSAIKNKGYYFAPCAYEIDNLSQLRDENFGPILHVIRYAADELDDVIDEINNSNFGLTFGLHTRIASRIREITDRMNVGNAYINRTMIGAVVGVQPFGGYGLSGTGPKAGGPHYLHRFGTEKVISIDTTRQGGNANLVSLEENIDDSDTFDLEYGK